MFNPNRVNIHELTIEEPDKQSELPFDPEREITKEDWKKMKAKLETCREDELWDSFSSFAMDMKILNSSIDLNLDQYVWRHMRDVLEKHGAPTDWNAYQAVAMKILDPTQDLNLDQATWQFMRDVLEKHKQNSEWGYLSSRAMQMKILDPAQNFDFDQATWQSIRGELEERRRRNEWDHFSNMAMQMKIIEPGMDLNIDQEAWRGMRDKLEECRRHDMWDNFLWQAVAMKILAAKKVEVTDRGLEITMPKKKKPLTSAIPPMPETKKF